MQEEHAIPLAGNAQSMPPPLSPLPRGLSDSRYPLLVVPDQGIYYPRRDSGVYRFMPALIHTAMYHTVQVCWSISTMRGDHMLSPHSAGRACRTLGGKHPVDDLQKLSRTSGTLLVLP